MNLSKKQKYAAAGTAAIILAAGSGAAYAYWTNSGNGTGTATTGTNTSITVNQTSSVSGLYPGSAPQTLSGDFTNSNQSQVYVAQVTVAIDPTWSSAVVNPTGPACTANDFTLVQPTATNHEIPSGTHVYSWGGASIALNDTSANQDNCKGVTVPLVYTSN